MKTSILRIFVILFLLPILEIRAQYFQKTENPVSSLYELIPPVGTAKIGVGTLTPFGKFHIYDFLLNRPLLKIEQEPDLFNGNSDSILFMGMKNGIYYGIYQTGPYNGYNYFNNSIGIGCLPPIGQPQQSIFANDAGCFMRGISIATFSGIGQPNAPGPIPPYIIILPKFRTVS